MPSAQAQLRVSSELERTAELTSLLVCDTVRTRFALYRPGERGIALYRPGERGIALCRPGDLGIAIYHP